MNSVLLSILISSCLITLASARFSCGNDPLQSSFAELLIATDCKGRLQKIDLCCTNHTKCYKTKTQREKCDAQFCTCSKAAAAKLPLCDLQMGNFCNTAKSFGGLNYKGK